MSEQSYIVRVYRCDQENPATVVGTVQAPEGNTQLSFVGVNELWTAMLRLRTEVNALPIHPPFGQADDD